ncbi:short-chain dehydrogenase reductase sdr : Short-chain dehydrogenase/reductase SDR OS=Haloferax larsenii JCM 13917 GN=C455_07747 PE=3 SV=1: adh_short [Gemmataceae bacterium]|nr:short-chain dehydrogenase reductase sdr : Short-chain dehydrogenase/reductase SDR OS=Haloferax larsenii JCM 13917 GN=C455_07747 PE=3 SV=1: adh_short [Gemmataceae bacterium]VTU01315.1 short-chain dehydrogenase reductase sdr : Short-chain dehydrogenase/reductase SDR OS=Haloferax larsenii JCM 13917 GN=C455_07747 PE=3 SV=1: adh_short [Gemmataceae bacterium]
MSSSRPVALVTGASAGIGREIARILAADHDLILSARREPELRALAAELAPATCHVVTADLADPAGPRALFDAVAAAGLKVDVLVNNAGFGDLGPFADADLAKLLRMIQVNVASLTELTGRFVPGMRARGRGRVLNVGSVAGFQPGPYMAVYYATKAFVNSFSEALSNELEGTGVTVTCLCPGPTVSEFAAVAGVQTLSQFKPGTAAATRPVAEAGVRAMRRGQRLVITGLKNKLLIFAERFLPRGVVIRAVRSLQDKRRKGEA